MRSVRSHGCFLFYFIFFVKIGIDTKKIMPQFIIALLQLCYMSICLFNWSGLNMLLPISTYLLTQIQWTWYYQYLHKQIQRQHSQHQSWKLQVNKMGVINHKPPCIQHYQYFKAKIKFSSKAKTSRYMSYSIQQVFIKLGLVLHHIATHRNLVLLMPSKIK